MSDQLQKKQKKIKLPIINLKNTQYNVIKQASNDFNIKICQDKNQDWGKLKFIKDVFWTDYPMNVEFYSKMKSYQKINWIPGIEQICKKNLLAKNLMIMERRFYEQFNFFPKTWILPDDIKEFKQQLEIKKNRTYILKPQALSQGKGIILFKKINDESLNELKNMVVQQYIIKPFLIDELKFDLRIYVLVTSLSPLKVYMYQEGIARFATQPYIKPKKSNLLNFFQHLTNYSINKNNPEFIFNENENQTDIGHKRSFSSILQKLDELVIYINKKGHDTQQLLIEMKLIIIRTMSSIQPYLNRTQQQFQPETDNDKFFHILGFDILLDYKLKPWLIEVNQSPSLSTDTPFDLNLKKQLIFDTFQILNLNCIKNRKKYQQDQLEKKDDMKLLKQKKLISKEDRQQQKIISNQNKDLWEQQNLRNYVNVVNEDTNIGLSDFINYRIDIFDLKYFGKQQNKKDEVFKNNQFEKKNSLSIILNENQKKYKSDTQKQIDTNEIKYINDNKDQNKKFNGNSIDSYKLNQFQYSQQEIDQNSDLLEDKKNFELLNENQKINILKQVNYISYSKYQSFKLNNQEVMIYLIDKIRKRLIIKIYIYEIIYWQFFKKLKQRKKNNTILRQFEFKIV